MEIVVEIASFYFACPTETAKFLSAQDSLYFRKSLILQEMFSINIQ